MLQVLYHSFPPRRSSNLAHSQSAAVLLHETALQTPRSTAFDDIGQRILQRPGDSDRHHPLAGPGDQAHAGFIGRALGEVQVVDPHRSEEPTSELQSLMRISYAGFCFINNNNRTEL